MSVFFKPAVAVTFLSLTLAACGTSDTSKDFGIDSTPIEDMEAGIWVDPNGCDHWIIDDGIEGYMTPRFNSNGLPVCREGAIPMSTSDFQRSITGDADLLSM